MGHVVMNVADVEPLLPFYRDVLGFQITDYGLKPYKLYFFHLNGRHRPQAPGVDRICALTARASVPPVACTARNQWSVEL